MKFKLFFLLLLSALTSKAQYDVVFNETDAYGSATDTQLVIKGYVINTSGSSDVFFWQLTKGTMPGAWSVRVKDKNQTHPASVTTSNFTLANNDSAEVEILLDPAMTTGAAALTFTVSRQSQPLDLVEANLSFNVWAVGTGETPTVTASVYPNPAISQLHIALLETVEMEIYNVHGQKVKTHTHAAGASAIDIEALPAGTYVLKYLRANGTPVSRQFIKLQN
ncbi:MAG TPA: T9SS type A sorting domain-containing protein [Bacteroidia bacterium]|nr:T9SS type A sorting domain-containing protein [Bacteroidia bacterium]